MSAELRLIDLWADTVDLYGGDKDQAYDYWKAIRGHSGFLMPENEYRFELIINDRVTTFHQAATAFDVAMELGAAEGGTVATAPVYSYRGAVVLVVDGNDLSRQVFGDGADERADDERFYFRCEYGTLATTLPVGSTAADVAQRIDLLVTT